MRMRRMRRSSSTPRIPSRKVRHTNSYESSEILCRHRSGLEFQHADASTECRNSPQCAPAKHHFDECVERVQQQESEGGAKEDCVEECMSHSETADLDAQSCTIANMYSLPPGSLRDRLRCS